MASKKKKKAQKTENTKGRTRSLVPLVTPDNAPPDLQGLLGLSRSVRFRLALNLGIITPGTPECMAFLSSSQEIQATALLEALRNRNIMSGAPKERTINVRVTIETDGIDETNTRFRSTDTHAARVPTSELGAHLRATCNQLTTAIEKR